jgi:hypothetical protein
MVLTMNIPGVRVLNYGLPDMKGQAWHVEFEGNYYVVSATDVPLSGPETMVFPANAAGEVTDWTELYVIHSIDHEAALFGALHTEYEAW